MIDKVARYDDLTHPVNDVDSLIRYFQRAAGRTQRLMEHAPWPVVVVDVEDGAERAASEASVAITALLDTPAP